MSCLKFLQMFEKGLLLSMNRKGFHGFSSRLVKPIPNTMLGSIAKTPKD